MSDQFSTVSDQEARKLGLSRDNEEMSRLTKTALTYGAVAGLLMSIFIGVSGFYITGDNAGFGFLKFLILAAALYPLLVKVKRNTLAGKSMKVGGFVGLKAGLAAGVVSGIVILFFNQKMALSASADGPSDYAINQFVLAGISFFECVVASLILSLIFLQFLKDDRPAK